MTAETKLRSAMADAVAPAHPDADQLVALARRRGMGIRRRRQALAAVGVAAALGIAAMAPGVVAGDHGADLSPATPTIVGTAPMSFDQSEISVITGRSTAAGLVYAVGLQASGSATNFRGQGDGGTPDSLVMTYAVFEFTPAGDTAAGEVGMNVQYEPPSTQAQGTAHHRMKCDTFMEQCKITHLADGSVLRTSAQSSEHGDQTGVMWTADLVRADHVRVVAYASNGSDITERDERINRREPVLTIDQLVAVVTQPWWGVQVPTYFEKQGDNIQPYNEVGGAIEATPSSSPTS